MSAINPYNSNYRTQIEQNLRQTTEQMKTGENLSKLFSEAEQNLLDAWSDVGNAKPEDQAKLEAMAHVAEQKYRRMSRIYEGFQQLIKNADETMRRVISNMGFR